MRGGPGSPSITEKDARRSDPFIKLLRRFELHRFWREYRKYSRAEAWIDMLFMAYHSPREIMWNGHAITLKPGEFMTSYRILVRRWRWSQKKLRGFLDSCESHGEVILKPGDNKTHIGTRLTICNYAEIHRSRAQPVDNSVDNFVDNSHQGNPASPRDTPNPQAEQCLAGSRAQLNPRDTPKLPPSKELGELGAHYKRSKRLRTTAAGEPQAVINTPGQLSMPAKAARVYEAFRLASGNLTRPPSKRDTEAIKRAIADNGGDWEPIRDTMRDSVAKAVARGDTVRLPTYGLAAWKNEEEAKQKVEHGKPVPVLSGLVGNIAGASTSPAQRRSRKQPTGADPEGKPGDGVTKAEQDAVKRVRREMGLEE